MAEHMNEQVPGLYRRRIGDVLVTAISDGYIDAPYEALQGIEAEAAAGILRDSFRPTPPRISVNCYLVQAGGRTAVVDTGSGDTMGPTLGHLAGLMARLGIAAEAVDTVLLTHMHPDHSNGLTGADGNRLFPAAEIAVDERDVAHWHDDGARFQIAPYQDRRRAPDADVFPNVSAVPLPGHTPGHTGYLVQSGEDSLLIWGDICHVPDIQVRRPDVTMAFDVDPEAAIRTRLRAFDMAVADRLLVAGMHLHFPGFSYMARDGDGYRLVPEAWTFSA